MNPAQIKTHFKIGEAAKLLGVSIETLRRWDRAGKIKTGRTPGGKRIFTQEDINNIDNLLENPEIQPQNKEISQQTYTIPQVENSEDLKKPTHPLSKPISTGNLITVFVYLVFFLILGGYILNLPNTTYFKNLSQRVDSAKALLSSAVSNIPTQKDKAVLGVETFVIPAIEEGGGPLNSLLSQAGKTASTIGNFFKNNPLSSFVLTVIQKQEQSESTSGNLKVNGKAVVAKDIEGLGDIRIKGTGVFGKVVTGVVDPYLLENDGSVQSTLEIKSIGDIDLESGGIVQTPNLRVQNNETLGGDLTVSGTLNALKLTITSDSSIGGNLTLTGTINGNTFSSSSLVFSGSSPSIYPTTANTQISLNASGTGAINIGNSSKGDIYIGGGSTTGTYCLITNSNGSLSCSSDITTGGNLHVNGGTIATGATSFNLLNQTATTISFAGATTSLSIGSSSGTTTINNALTVTGNLAENGGTISTTATTGNLFNTTATTLNLGGAATTLSVGATTGTTTVNNALTVTGTGTLNGNVVLGQSSSQTLAFNAKVTTSILPNATGNVDLGSSSLKWNNLYSNTINTSSTNTSGQAVFTQNPASTAITDASVLINPTTVTNNTSALLGIAVGGTEKARIDNNGNLTLQGNLTLSGTISNTSTTTSGDIYAYTDTSLTTTGANLSNFTFKNNNGSGSSTVNGITVTEQAANAGGTNTSNLINLSAAANGTVNGINISSATGFTNFFKTPTFNLDSSGNITGVVGLTATTLTGTVQTASQTNITAVGTLTSLGVTGNINSASGALQTSGVTRVDNSGNLTAVTGSFGGNVTPSLDATYNFGSATNRWLNAYFSGDVTAGDVVFKNKFRMTENGNGIDFYSPKGEKVASIDENGNFWVKGEIKHGKGN